VYRFRGASDAIREATLPALTDAFVLVTELGGLSFLLVALSVLYWVGDRESTVTVISYTLVALALTLALKAWFAAPRPPASVQAVAESPETSGYPSGHAISATVVYGGLVLARTRLRDPRYVLASGSVILLVGLSRVVIGVHYLGDVLVGYAVGAAVLGGLWLTVRHRAGMACLLAAAVAVGTLPITAGTEYVLLCVGGSLGGASALLRVDPRGLPEAESPLQTVTLAVTGLGFVGGTYWLAETLTAALFVVLAGFVLVAGVFLFPRVLAVWPLESRGA
jgi:membrane-associated phospholipid phosphatase